MFPNEKVNYQNSIRDEAEGMNSRFAGHRFLKQAEYRVRR